METLDQRRRRSATAREDLETQGSMGRSRDIETALGQGRETPEGSREPQEAAGTSGRLQGAAPCVGLVSPGMMERGLMASPFHSTRIQEEIQLQRSRPATLDQDARALERVKEEAMVTSAGMVPTSTERTAEAEARVARVETTTAGADGEARPSLMVLPCQGACQSGGGTLVSPRPSGASPEEGVSTELQAPEGQPEEQGELTLAVRTGQEVRPSSADQRELVPAQVGVGSDPLQDLLTQMVAENRALRYRLEQLETPSGWYGGRAPSAVCEGLEVSPISFAPDLQQAIGNAHMAGGVTPESLLSGDGRGVRSLGVGVSRRALMDFVEPSSELPSRAVPHGIPPPPTPSGTAVRDGDPAFRSFVPSPYKLPPPLPPAMSKGQGVERGLRSSGFDGSFEGPGYDLEGAQGLASRLQVAMGAKVGQVEGRSFAGPVGGLQELRGMGARPHLMIWVFRRLDLRWGTGCLIGMAIRIRLEERLSNPHQDRLLSRLEGIYGV